MSRDESSRSRAETLTYEIGSSESVSEAVVNAVATATRCDPVPTPGSSAEPSVLDPLYSVIDPDALDAIFDRPGCNTPRTDGHVAFSYHGYEVVVHSHGIVRLIATPDEGSADHRLLADCDGELTVSECPEPPRDDGD